MISLRGTKGPLFSFRNLALIRTSRIKQGLRRKEEFVAFLKRMGLLKVIERDGFCFCEKEHVQF